jgi:hypothetical protein
MAQEAFVAAGDPNRFPEQIREGLRPWSPPKVYARVSFFSATPQGMYDYATDKYVPVRSFDYIHKTWSSETPATQTQGPRRASLTEVEAAPNFATGKDHQMSPPGP